ncbi:hypothetical protein D3C83_133810 [compost metagenome]
MTAQDVDDVDALHRQHVDLRNVARGESEILIEFGAVDDQRVLPLELAERLAERGGLGLLAGDAVDNHQFTRLGLR